MELLLERMVLQGVDERVDATVQEHHDDGKVEIGAIKVHRVAEVKHEEIHLIVNPAGGEGCADQDKGLEDVATCPGHFFVPLAFGLVFLVASFLASEWLLADHGDHLVVADHHGA